MELKSRKDIRLPFYDYSENGVYFITICTFQRMNTLCTILCRGDPSGLPRTKLSALGKIADETMTYIDGYEHVSVDKYVIMPNHIHMLVSLNTPFGESPKVNINRLIGAYKSKVSTEWLKICKSESRIMGSVWQRSFMEHIIRNESDYLKHWQYIENNPLKWEFDQYFNSGQITF